MARLGSEAREAAEAQAQRWFLWAPVAFGVGCALYVTADTEPAWAPMLMLAASLTAMAVLVRRWHAAPRLLIIAVTLAAFAACGLVAGKARQSQVAAPLIVERITAEVSGRVIDVPSPGAGGGRLLIAPYAIEGLGPEELPRLVRLTVGPDALIGPGAAIRVRAMLNPSPGPASPGAYDFARDAYFRSVGGVGLAFGDPLIVHGPEPPLGQRIRIAVNEARWTLSRRIADRLGPESAGLGVAMVTGHEAWMDEATEEALRDSGLAHIISISGVHMAIVGGFVFFLVRGLVALWPWLALRVPGKKVAALAALVAVGVYLVISGAPPPAIRSAVTLSVAFVAILLDRQALTLHSLAVAALLVLALQPEAVVQPGFQMSFAATAALLALAEAWPRPVREINTPWPIRLVQRLRTWFAAAFMVSLVAGLATGPFAMQHFNRVAVYGLPANLATELLAAFVILPALAIGSVGEAIGVWTPALAVADWGIQGMIAIGSWFAGLPNATVTVASAPAIALPVAFGGVLWVCLWRGWVRWLGAPAALAVALWPRPAAPVAWIAADGGGAAVVQARQAVPLRPEAKAFAYELWSRRRGLGMPEDPEAARDRLFDCNRQRCWVRRDPSPRITAWWTRRQPKRADLVRLCQGEIVIYKGTAPLPDACTGRVVLTPEAFAKLGAAEVYAAREGRWRFVWSQPLRGERPWTRVAGD